MFLGRQKDHEISINNMWIHRNRKTTLEKKNEFLYYIGLKKHILLKS